ncbi:hypothetical protein RB2654_14370 [Rhodobacterales bacterium HTCC2654]|uniref:Uncharacterized protein n=1 Tax=Maritimibacter alkaliphilus HTCC2654 TaxID=314271 RepID=A3VGS3_9RHOB|nr:hypothetical protein RB2654_14370 [Rhodobacterales bacterium HTCC2654] [Maritimibacter alkaliphilus HTCC2654]
MPNAPGRSSATWRASGTSAPARRCPQRRPTAPCAS